MKADGIGVMRLEQVESVHNRIVISKETVDAFALFGIDICKTLRRDIPVFLDESLSDNHLLHAILARILKHLTTHHAVHGVAHLKGRIDKNAVCAPQHLRVHAAHRRSDDEVGALFVDHVAQ